MPGEDDTPEKIAEEVRKFLSSEEDIRKFIGEALFKATKSKLLRLQIAEENVKQLLADINAEPFTDLKLTSIPKEGKLKIEVEVETETTRRICVVASTHTEKGVIRHSKSIETTYLDTLPSETENGSAVKQETVKDVNKYAIPITQALISLLNFLINTGVIHHH